MGRSKAALDKLLEAGNNTKKKEQEKEQQTSGVSGTGSPEQKEKPNR